MIVLAIIPAVWIFLFILAWAMLHVFKASFKKTITTCCLVAIVLGIALPPLLVR